MIGLLAARASRLPFSTAPTPREFWVVYQWYKHEQPGQREGTIMSG